MENPKNKLNKKSILLIGSGGREHVLAWMITKSPQVKQIICAPGNVGMSKIEKCSCRNIKAEDLDSLKNLALQENVSLTIIGPEAPLAQGVTNLFQEYGLRVFGPNKKAAQLESSKVFAKQLMQKNNIPTANFKIFENAQEALIFAKEKSYPLVIKADGLAVGKGVMICKNYEQALEAIDRILVQKRFGESGKQIIIEDYLEGQEVSYLAFVDGKRILPLASSQDHKPVFDNDQGPNTGGMGAYSPAPVVTAEVEQKILNRIAYPLIDALQAEGIDYRGILYIGLMICDGDPYVLEFNVRFGDPEAQALLPRLETDLVPIMEATVDGNLEGFSLNWKPGACLAVVAASKGYPGTYKKDFPITGLDELAGIPGIEIFHSGTALLNGQLVTAGGRVLCVSALGKNLQEAYNKAYLGISKIHFEGMHFRTDIGKKALDHG